MAVRLIGWSESSETVTSVGVATLGSTTMTFGGCAAGAATALSGGVVWAPRAATMPNIVAVLIPAAAMRAPRAGWRRRVRAGAGSVIVVPALVVVVVIVIVIVVFEPIVIVVVVVIVVVGGRWVCLWLGWCRADKRAVNTGADGSVVVG